MKFNDYNVKPIVNVAIKFEQDLSLVRQRARKIASLAGLSTQDQTRLTTAISEVARDMFQQTGSGQVQFCLAEQNGDQMLLVSIFDAGLSIPDSDIMLNDASQSHNGLGGGLTEARKLVDLFSVKREVGHGTCVYLGKRIPLEVVRITNDKIQTWTDTLVKEAAHTPLQELQQQNQTLFRMLDELHEKEQTLQYQLSEIQRLEKVRDDLTRTMVHDLRNPLSIIHSALEGLMMSNVTLSDGPKEMLEIAHVSTQRMVKLVSNILDVSRLENGQMPLYRRPISLTELIVETLDAQSPLANFKRISLEHCIPDDLPAIEADADLIGRVLQNLLDNAIKFTPKEGAVMVTVAESDKAKTNRGNPSIVVSIADSGPGIPPQIQKRLFEKFVTGAQEESGSGLGLAFCKLAIEAHDGHINVESQSEQGTKFTFTVPAIQPSQG